MLTYMTFFIASIVLALIVRFVYKAISESSMSVSTSKDRIAIISNAPADNKDNAARKDATGKPNRPGQIAPQPAASTSAEKIDWGLQGNGKRAGKQPEQHGTGVSEAGHCSLYSVSTSEPKTRRSNKVGWPYRNEKPGLSNKASKARQKAAPENPNLETVSKPWGW
jgi:hypothetical protein